MIRAFSAGEVLGSCVLGRRFRLPQAGMADAVGVIPAFKIQFNGLFQVGNRILACGSKTGDVHVKALRDEELVFPVQTIGHRFHQQTNTTSFKHQQASAAPSQQFSMAGNKNIQSRKISAFGPAHDWG